MAKNRIGQHSEYGFGELPTRLSIASAFSINGRRTAWIELSSPQKDFGACWGSANPKAGAISVRVLHLFLRGPVGHARKIVKERFIRARDRAKEDQAHEFEFPFAGLPPRGIRPARATAMVVPYRHRWRFPL